MNKTEIYYKFIFPTYESLSRKTGSQTITSDGVDQLGEVKALCDKCPSRVITYDRLNSTLKSYVDKWLSFPKYFNLRNYWDANPCQEGGMSLVVSHTPEAGAAWKKFQVDTKTIYCSLMISSGDFFYKFCLPDEVISKSGLLEEIFDSGFYLNWLITDNDNVLYRTIPRAIHFNNSDAVYLSNNPSSASYIRDTVNYPGYPYSDLSRFNSPSPINPAIGTEKRVFVQHYFSDYFQFGRHASTDAIQSYTGLNEDLKMDFLELEATRRILYYYNGTQLRNPDNNNLITISSTNDIPILADKVDIGLPEGVPQGGAWWSSTEQTEDDEPDASKRMCWPFQINKYNSTTNSWEEITLYTRWAYAQNHCAYLRDFTRRVVVQLKDNLNRIGKNTQISYEPPDIYRTDRGGCPPLQIPYNLLRYAMNDRPPFTDCETVLVMWVADKDPMSSDITSVADLHNKCNFQQYAIPVSCRCCYKDDDSCNTKRFLVLYPHGATGEADDEYGFHYRRSEKYKKGIFREALYLQDLMRYSNDYVISFKNIAYSYPSTKGYDIQRHLFTKLKKNASSDFPNMPISFKELYVKKTYETVSNHREKQYYYIKVDKKDGSNKVYDINTSNTSLSTCIVKGSDNNTVFKPSLVLTRDKYSRWDLADNAWFIRDNIFIALFDASDPAFSTRSGKLTIYNSEALRSNLQSIASVSTNWNDLYISSLGVSPYGQVNKDFLKFSGSITGSTYIMLPLDVLDGHITIDGVTYGSAKSNRLIVVGFKDVFDYTNEGCHHFHYDQSTKKYVLTENQDRQYTAYVMSLNYTP